MGLKSIWITLLAFVFSGCISISSLNPFGEEPKKDEKIDLKTIKNAPLWINQTKEKNYINTIAYVNIKNKLTDFDKQRVVLQASEILSRKIYIKIVNYYKNYEKTLVNPITFTKDIENIAKQISLEAVSKSKIRESWLSLDKNLFIKLSVNSHFVAQEIQNKSKKIYKVNQNLYKNILSNRANSLLIEYLEN